MADSTEALEDKMPGLSQTDCLAGKGSEGDIIIIIIIIMYRVRQ